MLNLIYGPSGSGKTEKIIQSIRRDIESRTRCFLLIPEQQAYTSERDLSEALPSNAGLYFEVVHFSGLADDVFHEYGGVTARSADPALSALLMWDTLRTLSPQLLRYGRGNAKDSTLTSLMLGAVEELRSSGIDVEALEAASKNDALDPHLRAKLSDVALIDAVYHARLEEVFGEDPADKLQKMAKLLRAHAFFKDANIYVDSFTSFTSPEYDVIEALLSQGANLTVTLCADAPRSALPHFEVINETSSRLASIAARVLCPVTRQTLTAAPSQKPRALALLCDGIWDFSIKQESLPKIDESEQENVRCVKCANLYEEAEVAALHVLELVMSGMKYRDIAVVVRDTENYRGVLDAAFERHHIPFFLSERTDLSSKPLSRLVLCSLRAAAHGYRQSDVLSLLKTGLCGIELPDAAMFEEYCETWHISGRRFTDTLWSMNPDGLTDQTSPRAKIILERANHVRALLIPPLERLGAQLRSADTVKEMCRALYGYLLDVNVPARLSERAESELSSGQKREAGESVRLYSLLSDLLASLARTLPDTKMNADEFISVLSLLFSHSDLGSIPPSNDCVVIGSAATLRVENVRASLLLGLCEGEFPAAVTDEGLFTDRDKEALEALDLSFRSGQRIKSSEEMFYVYRALSKPRERLFLSCVRAETDGSARTPSLAFRRACLLLGMKESEPNMQRIEEAAASSQTDDTAPPLSAPPFDSPTTLRLSQTRIKSFVLCPYRHYASYILGLREPVDSTPSYADDGTFLHYVFENLLVSCRTENGTLCLPSEEELEALTDRIIDAYVASLFPYAPPTDHRLLHLFARLRRLALLMLRHVLAEITGSSFVPTDFEKPIGRYGEHALPPVTLTLKDGSEVLLTGKIDRVDIYERDGKRYVRVVDYKTGEHIFSPEDVRSGMDIQLILYLSAYLSSDPRAEAFGAEYLYIKTEKGTSAVKKSGFYLDDEELKAAAGSAGDTSCLTGLKPFSKEEIDFLRTEMSQTVCDIAARMIAGEAQKTPSKEACGFCPIKPHCDKAYRKE